MTAPRPYTLIAELTYRCPLRCPYCSNPTELRGASNELSTETWARVFVEAEALGVMQLHLTGGEPLARKDLETLVERARAADLYTNLITAGVPLTRARLAELARRGLDNVQLSVQADEASAADHIAGFEAHAQKREVARWVKELGLALTINVVLHRANIERVPELVALAEALSADRLELANAQYLGWALANRAALLPTKEAIDAAFAVAAEAKARLSGKMELVFVKPDYVADRPRACMDGWANRYVHVDPDGFVLPCHAARTLPGLAFDNVGEKSLAAIWETSEALNRFRGTAFLPEPCRSCERREVDFGGCRCQAFHLAGDAASTDPACSLAPSHDRVLEARRLARNSEGPRYLYRGPPART